jgi:hypothetical protein
VLPATPPRAAFGKLVACEARLAWREPVGLVLSAALPNVGQLTPLGSSVQALQDASQGHFPPTGSLLVLAAYAVCFALLSMRSFRWE